MLRKEVELLAPAKNAETGIAAINHGADAVYIGASKFGARAQAGNSVEDIERLAKYAHKYGSRVFVTVNTLLTDKELEEAELLIWRLWEAGTDAVIVQDTRIAALNLPKIELHASTQCDIRTPERVEQLSKMGFSQVVLARELSLREIAAAAAVPNVVVETFVHGALCVSYSGRCYMSEEVCGRSANRGECAQLCRLPYDLVNENDETLMKGKYLLSLHDFNASRKLEELLAAGARCLKIEGRLKSTEYVKNITAYYRKQLDKVLENSDLTKSSWGSCRYGFEPDPRRTFYRGGTEFFLNGQRDKGLCTMSTGKAIGQPLEPGAKLSNGDGVCWIGEDGQLKGCMIDGTEKLPKGVKLFRNNDIEMERILGRADSAERKIKLRIKVCCKEDIEIESVTEGIKTLTRHKAEWGEAKNPEKMMSAWEEQFRRLGDTEFEAESVDLEFAEMPFVPVSVLANWRREHIDAIRKELETKFIADYRAMRDKERNGDAQKGIEHQRPANELMRCRYCIRYEVGMCMKEKDTYHGRLWLVNSHGQRFEIKSDCNKCEMVIIK